MIWAILIGSSYGMLQLHRGLHGVHLAAIIIGALAGGWIGFYLWCAWIDFFPGARERYEEKCRERGDWK